MKVTKEDVEKAKAALDAALDVHALNVPIAAGVYPSLDTLDALEAATAAYKKYIKLKRENENESN